MFLLPSLVFGVAVVLLLGGDLRRLGHVRFRLTLCVPAALALQIILFSPLGGGIPPSTEAGLHVTSYALLALFAVANLRIRAFVPVLLGTASNGLAIAANGGRMPVAVDAARAAGISLAPGANVSEHARHLSFLGDVFALPAGVPFANTFSVGDILVGAGVAAFIVLVCVDTDPAPLLSVARVLRPLRTRAYRRLLLGGLVSMIGDWITVGALVGWIYARSHSTAAVAALLVARIAPPVLGGAVAGFVVDRLPNVRLLVAVELGRGLVVAGALTGVTVGFEPAAFAATAVSGMLAALTATTIPAVVPSLVSPQELAAANADMGVARDIARAGGSLAAGALLSLAGAAVALGSDLATFAAAALLYAGLRGTAATRPRRSGSVSLDGLRYLLRSRRLTALVCAFAAATIATGMVNATLPRYLEHLGLGSSGYGYGMAALGVGLAAGEALVGFARVGSGGGGWIGIALLLMAGLFALLGLGSQLVTAFLFLGLIGFVDGTTDVLFDTVVQQEADPQHRGAIFGFASACFTTTMLGAVALAPLANDLLPSNRVVLGAAVFLVAAAAFALAGLRGPARLAEPARTGSA